MKRKIAAIDVGTTKVCTIMGTLDSTSGLRVLGVGIAPSHGIEKALVANVVQAKESIRQSIRKAELMAGYKISLADQIRSTNGLRAKTQVRDGKTA